MANNITIKDSAGDPQVVKTTDNAGVHTHHHNVDSMPADPFGAIADAAVVTDTTGTISGKLRGLVKWAFERMPASLGRKAASASLSVGLSTDPFPNKVSTVNSSSTPLGNGSVFTGTAEDVSAYHGITVNVFSDVDSESSGGLELQFSSDGTNWDIAYPFDVTGGVAKQIRLLVEAQYYRVVYTNGGTPQGSFRLQSILMSLPLPPTDFPSSQSPLPVTATFEGSMSIGDITLNPSTNTIGRVQIRNNADGANIDPVAEGTFTGRIGEVQASPTANTVLDRLKALLTGIVLAAGSARIGKVTVRNAADGADIDPVAETTFTGRIGEVQASPTSNTVLARLKDLLTGIVLGAGTNAIGNVGLEPRTSGGLSVARYIDLGTTGQVVKNAAGQVFGWRITNQRAGALYVKIYDKATAADETNTPIITLALLQGQAETDCFPHGIAFANGVSVRATTAIADNSTAAPGSNEAVVNIFYK